MRALERFYFTPLSTPVFHQLPMKFFTKSTFFLTFLLSFFYFPFKTSTSFLNGVKFVTVAKKWERHYKHTKDRAGSDITTFHRCMLVAIKLNSTCPNLRAIINCPSLHLSSFTSGIQRAPCVLPPHEFTAWWGTFFFSPICNYLLQFCTHVCRFPGVTTNNADILSWCYV